MFPSRSSNSLGDPTPRPGDRPDALPPEQPKPVDIPEPTAPHPSPSEPPVVDPPPPTPSPEAPPPIHSGPPLNPRDSRRTNHPSRPRIQVADRALAMEMHSDGPARTSLTSATRNRVISLDKTNLKFVVQGKEAVFGKRR